MKNKIVRHVSFFCAILEIVLVTSCQPIFTDSSTREKITSINLEDGYYFGPTWMSDNIIVFDYATSIDNNYQETVKPKLRFYDIDGTIWKEIPIPDDENCRLLNFVFLQKLPDQNLGFLNTCLTDNGTDIHTIREMDIATGEIKTLVEPEFIKTPGEFSFSPDMSELIQEKMVGRYLSNQIFHKQGNKWTQIVPDFTRAMYPDWSPNDREIAFWGTEKYKGGDPKDFTTLQEILGLSSYPWDLYISTPEGIFLKKILSSILDPGSVKWSPEGEDIAFSGTINRTQGIWLINTVTTELTRVWSKRGDFDWAPDGKNIVILDEETDQVGKILSQRINIIYLK